MRNRISRRDAVECCEQLFGARIWSGTVDAILERVADVFEEPDADLLDRVRAAKALNMDETGWRTAGERRALWGAFSDRHAVLRVRADRHEDHQGAAWRHGRDRDVGSLVGLQPPADRSSPGLLGAPATGLQGPRRGPGRREGLRRGGPADCDELFWTWEIYQHTRERKELSRRIRALRRALKPLLRGCAGKEARYSHIRGIARNLLKVWPALWTFAEHRGMQPTNNHAERALRGAVIYRKLRLGSQSQTARGASSGCSQCTPPAASNAGLFTNTSSTCSRPPAQAIRSRCSPDSRRRPANPLNAYSYL